MSNSGTATALGIVGIVVGILGGILFGVFGGAVGLICGILGMIIGVNAKKAGNPKGQTGFICGLLGVIFSAIFIIGCAACGICAKSGGASSNYGCTGCVGASCQAKKDVNDLGDQWEKAWEDALKDVDWDSLK